MATTTKTTTSSITKTTTLMDKLFSLSTISAERTAAHIDATLKESASKNCSAVGCYPTADDIFIEYCSFVSNAIYDGSISVNIYTNDFNREDISLSIKIENAKDLLKKIEILEGILGDYLVFEDTLDRGFCGRTKDGCYSYRVVAATAATTKSGE